MYFTSFYVLCFCSNELFLNNICFKSMWDFSLVKDVREFDEGSEKKEGSLIFRESQEENDFSLLIINYCQPFYKKVIHF